VFADYLCGLFHPSRLCRVPSCGSGLPSFLFRTVYHTRCFFYRDCGDANCPCSSSFFTSTWLSLAVFTAAVVRKRVGNERLSSWFLSSCAAAYRSWRQVISALFHAFHRITPRSTGVFVRAVIPYSLVASCKQVDPPDQGFRCHLHPVPLLLLSKYLQSFLALNGVTQATAASPVG